MLHAPIIPPTPVPPKIPPYDFLPQVFIRELSETEVDVAETPFFYNDGGTPAYLARLPDGVAPLTPAHTGPEVSRGAEHRVTGTIGFKPTPPYGNETQLGFEGETVRYEPMWATRDAAAAFGITLVEPGQGIAIDSPGGLLHQNQYEYGVFAGHWSPYQNTNPTGPDGGNMLLSVVCTDLEHHDFPHVFASTDPQFPLVISGGRYWHHEQRICLADLWVPQGSALYIPPKPLLLGSQCIDLHNNRNSARAAWGDIRAHSIVTHTLLQTTDSFTYWYWNAADTEHTPLEVYRP
ncbi:hypothetical protein FHS95_001402 [Sphingomonas naasensis]|uniref:Uncharacterized protein n=1 Tax=Sphingomonas naasensis TaxID=1344951 RepID=A0A4S1WC98_9SPHN|nr:hypothetical protein [Sphingomonas naasensis]NIJ19733.1 hypothetical protein [Sphingomonas naasensis]TGX40123.1 hypothetical protein E5A74_16280 [Sphingomonas naasensis]